MQDTYPGYSCQTVQPLVPHIGPTNATDIGPAIATHIGTTDASIGDNVNRGVASAERGVA